MCLVNHSHLTHRIGMASNMSGIYLLASVLCLAIGGSVAQYVEGNYNVTAVCTTVKNGVQLGSIVSCDYYYVCTQNGPVKTNCPTGYSYDFRAQTCSPTGSVDCYYGVANPCQGKVGANWVPVAGTCSDYVYCNNDVAVGSGSCGNLRFDATAQNCTYGTCSNSPTSGPNLLSPCDVIPPETYFGSMTNCSLYNYCYTDGTMGTGACSLGAFVVQSDACGYDTNGNCDRITGGAVPESCNTTGQMIPDNVTCGNYYYCENNVYVSKSCPSGQYFNLTNQCVSRQLATPAAGCNRCQYAQVAFVNAVDTQNCNEYYYCNNGVSDGIEDCPDNYFFDEANQGCYPYADLPAYQQNNGACAGAKAPTTTSNTTATTNTTTTTTTTTTTIAPT